MRCQAGLAWGSEPGRLLPPALIPPAPAPPKPQQEGREGGEGCGSLLGPPRARGTDCGRAGFSRKSGVSLSLLLRVLYGTPSLPESHSGLPSKAEAGSGSAVKLLSELQSQERSAAVNRGGQEGALDGEAKTVSCGFASQPDIALVSERFVLDAVTQRRHAIQWLRASDKMNKCIAL